MIDRSDVSAAVRVEENTSAPRELSAEELRFSTQIAETFSSTRELAGAKNFVGQERALANFR